MTAGDTYSREYTRGQWSLYAFLNVDYEALHMHTGSLKINIFKVLLGGRKGVTTKSTLCTLLIMLTFLDDPLALQCLCSQQERICRYEKDQGMTMFTV